MVDFRCANRRTCTDPLVSCSVPLLALYRDRNWSRGLHRRAWRPRCRSSRCGRHARVRSSRRRDRRSRWSAGGSGQGSLRSSWRGDRWSRWSAGGGRRTAGRLVVDGTLGYARLWAWRLRPTDLGGGCGCQICSRGSAGTGWGAMLYPRLGPGLRHGRRVRLHRLNSLLPRRSDRTWCGSGCVLSTKGDWRRWRVSHLRLLHRGASGAAFRVPGLPSKPEPGQKTLSGRWRWRRIPYGYGTLSRPRARRR
jgi:hypothetical protein